MQNKLEFVTGVSKTYHLGGNDWYAVEQDDDKVMLVDIDCRIGDEMLRTPWSDGDWKSEEGENGQAILDYVNKLADTYFDDIKYAIIPRTVEAGTGKLENAFMWPMSYEEFDNNKTIGSKIGCNANCSVWTRTFSGVINNDRFAWRVADIDGDLGDGSNVGNTLCVAPAFYLKKSAIDHITDDNEIIFVQNK